jgi:hypothetical protein
MTAIAREGAGSTSLSLNAFPIIFVACVSFCSMFNLIVLSAANSPFKIHHPLHSFHL